ncbi:MAG: hypothetical protein IJ187_01705 [Neisseriaceae bacterium]|nr:hypothetical protein [Neisseriaceae bacterium]
MKLYLFLLLALLGLTACGEQSQTQTNIELTAQQQEILQHQNAEQREILNQVYQSGKTVDVCVENSIRKYACNQELRQHIEIIEKAIKSGVSKKDLRMFISEHLL